MKIKALAGALALAASSGSFAITVTSVPTTIGDSATGAVPIFGFAFTEMFDLDLGTSGSGLTLLFSNFTSNNYVAGNTVGLLLSKGATFVGSATWSATGLSNVLGSFSGLSAGAGNDYELRVGAWHTPTFANKTATWGGNVAVVPEPGTYALLLAGLGVVGFVAKRRRPQA
jgi:PEP-CTERM motif